MNRWKSINSIRERYRLNSNFKEWFQFEEQQKPLRLVWNSARASARDQAASTNIGTPRSSSWPRGQSLLIWISFIAINWRDGVCSGPRSYCGKTNIAVVCTRQPPGHDRAMFPTIVSRVPTLSFCKYPTTDALRTRCIRFEIVQWPIDAMMKG